MSKIYIVILNWNNWQDTIECLESVFRLEYPNYSIIVCDNDSEDGSVEHITSWAEGDLDVFVPSGHPLRYLTFPPVSKPIPLKVYTASEAGACGATEKQDERLVIIKTGKNLGFAGGFNVGFRFALARNDSEYIWMLSNDTVVKPDALIALVNRMKERPAAGVCGSILRYYDNSNTIQTLGGGILNEWIGTTKLIGRNQKFDNDIDARLVEKKMTYVYGASMFLSKNFLKDIGLMSEDYFLYFEEVDWEARNRGRYDLVFAPGSIVFHKEGGTIGTSFQIAQKSPKADYYSFSSRIKYFKKYRSNRLLFVYLLSLVYVSHRFILGRRKNALSILRSVLDSF